MRAGACVECDEVKHGRSWVMSRGEVSFLNIRSFKVRAPIIRLMSLRLGGIPERQRELG